MSEDLTYLRRRLSEIEAERAAAIRGVPEDAGDTDMWAAPNWATHAVEQTHSKVDLYQGNLVYALGSLVTETVCDNGRVTMTFKFDGIEIKPLVSDDVANGWCSDD